MEKEREVLSLRAALSLVILLRFWSHIRSHPPNHHRSQLRRYRRNINIYTWRRVEANKSHNAAQGSSDFLPSWKSRALRDVIFIAAQGAKFVFELEGVWDAADSIDNLWWVICWDWFTGGDWLQGMWSPLTTPPGGGMDQASTGASKYWSWEGREEEEARCQERADRTPRALQMDTVSYKH